MATQPVGSSTTTSKGTTTYGAVNANGTQYQSFTPAAPAQSSLPSGVVAPASGGTISANQQAANWNTAVTAATPTMTNGVVDQVAPSGAKIDPTTGQPFGTPTSGQVSTTQNGVTKYYNAPAGVDLTPEQQAVVNAGGAEPISTIPQTGGGGFNTSVEAAAAAEQAFVNQGEPTEEQQKLNATVEEGAPYDLQMEEIQKEAATAQGGQTGAYSTAVAAKYNSQIADLQTKKSAAITDALDKIETAMKTGRQTDYDNAVAQYNTAINQDQAQQGLNTAKATAETNNAKTQADTAAQTFQNTVATVAPAIQARINAGEDPSAILQDYISKGYDPTVLNAALVTYQQEQQKVNIANNASTIDTLSKTAVGDTVTLPGLGKVTVLGTTNGKVTTLDTANGMMEQQFNPQTGRMELSYIKDENGENISSDALIKSIMTALTNPNVNVEQIKSLINGVNPDLGSNIKNTDSSTGGGMDFKAAITNQESGNYSAVNATSGALGAYQMMPDKLSLIGLDPNNPADIQKFLNTPALQDQAFQKYTDGLSAKYNGDTSKMAAAYYGGQLGVDNLGTPAGDKQGKYNKDGSLTGYPSVNEYVASINKKMTPDLMEKWTSSGTIDESAPPAAAATTVDSKTGMTGDGLWQAAITFATKNTLPPASYGGSAKDKAQIKAARDFAQNKASAIAMVAGVNIADVQKDYKADSSALNKIYAMTTGINAYEGQAELNADLVTKNMNALAADGSPLINKYVQWSKQEGTGDPQLQALQTSIFAFTKEYAKVVSGGSLSVQALTDSASTEASKLLNTAMTPDQFNAALSTMKTEMANRALSSKVALNNTSAGQDLPNLTAFYKTAAASMGTETLQVNNEEEVSEMSEGIQDPANGLLGADGFMAPATWQNLKAQWTGDPKDFDIYFAIYKNPLNKSY